MTKLIRGFFYIIFGFFGAQIGWRLSTVTFGFYQQLPSEAQRVNAFAFICIGFLLGFSISSLFANMFLKIIEMAIAHLQKLSLLQILMGSIGLIIGLIISYLISLPLSIIPFANIPGIGEYLPPILKLLLAMFFAYLGIFFGTRMSLFNNINQILDGSVKDGDLIAGRNYKLLDTSVIIDGRVSDITRTGFLEGTIVVPRFVLRELQQIADSSDTQKRNRGRRGLDMLNSLRKEFGISILEKEFTEPGVDGKLIKLANELRATIVTTDYNLNKLASLQGIHILNINELANAVKPTMIPGELMKVRILKEGKEPAQGVAYLDDGTMVVVEGGKRHLGEMISIEVTSALQTVAGKMIFAKLRSSGESERKNVDDGSDYARDNP
jgi:uncharacterized protein YacL